MFSQKPPRAEACLALYPLRWLKEDVNPVTPGRVQAAACNLDIMSAGNGNQGVNSWIFIEFKSQTFCKVTCRRVWKKERR